MWIQVIMLYFMVLLKVIIVIMTQQGVWSLQIAPSPSASSALMVALRFPSPRIKLVDFGLSKQLPEHMRLSFALLVTAMAPGAAGADPLAVSAALRVKNGV
jgi:hypothetical protein